jgi:hypothetical protein
MKKSTKTIAIMMLLVLFTTGCKPVYVDVGLATNTPNKSNNMFSENQSTDVLDLTAANTMMPDENVILSEKISGIIVEAYKKLGTTETILMESNSITNYYLAAKGIPSNYTVDEQLEKPILSISTDSSKEELVYLVLLHTLTTKYKDSVYFIDEDYLAHPYNREMFKAIFVSDNYNAAGYETVKDYYHAIEEGKCKAPSDALIMRFDTECLYAYGDMFGVNDLWTKLFATTKNLSQ